MSVPLPKTGRENLAPPDAAEVEVLSRGVLAAIRPVGGHTDVQKMLASSLFLSMTGHPATFGGAPLGPGEFAEALAARNAAFRGRIVQIMVLLALVLRPLPPEVARRVAAYSAEMGVDEEMIRIAQRFADGSLGLAAVDFERNGYAAGWDAASATALHTARKLDTAWDLDVADPELAARWEALEKLPEGTLGRRVTEFYRARGFTYPGRPGSAPPLLAQHDWVHLVADYGTTVESELEVFAFIARANDDPRAFSLLAMVVSLFETGYLRSGAGLFEASPGHLSESGMADRVADAMRRGALCRGTVDFLAVDWFELADLDVNEVRRHFGVPEKSKDAQAAGSVGPWDPGGISAFQVSSGRVLADKLGVPYESFGAQVALPTRPSGAES